MSSDRTDFGRALIRWREKRGFAQKDFARALGMDPGTLCHLERHQKPSARQLIALEWDIEPPVPINQLRRYAAPMLRSDVLRKWNRDRARLLRVQREAREGER